MTMLTAVAAQAFCICGWPEYLRDSLELNASVGGAKIISPDSGSKFSKI